MSISALYNNNNNNNKNNNHNNNNNNNNKNSDNNVQEFRGLYSLNPVQEDSDIVHTKTKCLCNLFSFPLCSLMQGGRCQIANAYQRMKLPSNGFYGLLCWQAPQLILLLHGKSRNKNAHRNVTVHCPYSIFDYSKIVEALRVPPPHEHKRIDGPLKWSFRCVNILLLLGFYYKDDKKRENMNM